MCSSVFSEPGGQGEKAGTVLFFSLSDRSAPLPIFILTKNNVKTFLWGGRAASLPIPPFFPLYRRFQLWVAESHPLATHEAAPFLPGRDHWAPSTSPTWPTRASPDAQHGPPNTRTPSPQPLPLLTPPFIRGFLRGALLSAPHPGPSVTASAPAAP